MKALLVKMSSLGDIVHTLPAISDLQAARPDVRLHWLVERSYAELAGWHQGVEQVWPIDQRSWLRQRRWVDWRAFVAQRQQWREQHFDLVVDAQGLIKSALIARSVGARDCHGFDRASSREALAGWLMSSAHGVDPLLPAVARTRHLFAEVFGYRLSASVDFGIQHHFVRVTRDERAMVLLPGSSWASKYWPRAHWQQLASQAMTAGWRVSVVWGSDDERRFAQQLAAVLPQINLATHRETITEVATRLAGAGMVVGLDSGFCHLAAALGKPVIALFGASSATRFGVLGSPASNLSVCLSCSPCHQRQCPRLSSGEHDAPCMTALTAEAVWNQILALSPC
ncbi:MAG: lipopolysaccharide heptosyltransferase I [Alcanivoracaceae bacterium]